MPTIKQELETHLTNHTKVYIINKLLSDAKQFVLDDLGIPDELKKEAKDWIVTRLSIWRDKIQGI